MKPLRTFALAGAAVLALGAGTLAAAAVKSMHTLVVRLPDGTVERIDYVGDVAPKVRLDGGVSPIAALDPFAPLPADPAFARLEQMSAQMDRQVALTMRDLASRTPPAGADGLRMADLGRPPPGATGFSMVSTANGSGVCTHSVEYRALGDGKPPQVVSRTSGDCAQAPGQATAVAPASRAADGLSHTAYVGGAAARSQPGQHWE